MITNCKRCGAAIEYEVVEIGGITTPKPNYCDGCGKIAYAEYLAEQHRSERNAAYEDCVPPLYRATDIAKLPCAEEQVRRVLAWRPDKDGKGLLIHGATGKGKTRAACLLLKTLIMGQCVVPVCFWAGELERGVACAWERKNGYEALFQRAANAGILYIDDFGKDKFTDRYESFVFQLFDARMANMRPTIITTNYVGSGLVGRFVDRERGVPFARRLAESMEVVGL